MTTMVNRNIHMKKELWKRWWLWLIVLIVSIGTALLWVFLYPLAYLPHERITVQVPYRLTDPPSGIMPMGETIYHPKPQVPHGHPGIDFGWEAGDSHDVISSSSGAVASIIQGASDPGKWDVEVQSGVYSLRYKELEDLAAGLQIGDHVGANDLIGHAGHYCDNSGPNAQEHCWFNFHWELASRSIAMDRWCPVSYLDEISRQSLETIWSAISADHKVKSQFPYICSGDYAGKEE